MPGYINPATGAYNGGDKQPGEIEVGLRPSLDHYFSFQTMAWELDVARSKRALKKVPTKVFIETVFAPAPDAVDAPADYVWARENSVLFQAGIGLSRRLPINGDVYGSKADIVGLAFWLLTHAGNPATGYTDVAPTAPLPEGVTLPVLTPEQSALFVGGIISSVEYDRVLVLLEAYGVE